MGRTTSPSPWKHDGAAAGKIGGEHAERSTHLLEAVALQQARQKAGHALADHEARAAERPPRHVAEAHGAAGAGDFIGRGSAGIGGRGDGAGAHAGDAIDGNSGTLQDVENAGMGDSPGESSAQRQADFRRRRRGALGNQSRVMPVPLDPPGAPQSGEEAADRARSFHIPLPMPANMAGNRANSLLYRLRMCNSRSRFRILTKAPARRKKIPIRAAG